MEFIRESSEHHFLTALEKCKSRRTEWIYMHFVFSHQLRHSRLMETLDQLQETIDTAERKSTAFFEQMQDDLKDFKAGYAYHFKDGDIIVLIHAPEEHDKNEARYCFNKYAQSLPENIRHYGSLEHEMYKFQKMSDQKLLSTKRIEMLRGLGDKNKIESIPIRRKRREGALVMIVEDDRFTSAYTTSILNKTFDVCHAKNGEEAVAMYIDQAPDIVLLDIHLPGISGHEALQLLRRIDQDGFMVMLSVDASSENVLGATRSGAQTFLKKPFSKDRLLATIRKSQHIRQHESFVRDLAQV